MATGVLLVCLGRATRIAEYLMAGPKRYRAVLRLGISTDSHDVDGQVTATAPVTVDRSEVEMALTGYRGSISQIPPMVSAIKQNGQPLYKLARQGITVERAPRQVEITELELMDWHPPKLTLELTCSPGTYVRALARDLGQELRCGAHLTALTRLASGKFVQSQAIDLEQFAAAVEAADSGEWNASKTRKVPDWHHLVLPLDAGLDHLPACTLGSEASRRIRSGQSLLADQVVAPRDQLCRAYGACNSDNKLVALLRFDDHARLWRPHKVFHPL
jgi:tRNA pseudouridine55 synthase